MNGFHDLKSFLDIKADLYNRPEFIPSDPISIPHLFRQKEDIEIAGFLTAVISWGQRKTILASARSLMHLMDDNPFDFVMGSSAADQKSLMHFNHRTFNGSDCQYFILALRNLYTHHGGLEKPFISRYSAEPVDIKRSLHQLKETFFELPHMNRTRKHLPDPFKGSAAKRMNMFLRWMVRKDGRGVDFG
ncbi:MAG: DUF2400 domain-containing protein, partial [Bacteroidales bacterium]|nr:DUF2400 domain-containing protein [Bacteroidales bacterium]